jgi:hypothetical protein
MPLTNWTLTDELVSDSLHMRDVALGLDKPSVVKDLTWVKETWGQRLVEKTPHLKLQAAWEDDGMLGDEIPDIERAISRSTHSRVSAVRDLQQDEGKPVMTSDDRSLFDALEGAVRKQRWSDGAACAVSIHAERWAQHAEVLIETTQSLDQTYELIFDPETPEWERNTLIEDTVTLEATLQSSAQALVEGEEEIALPKVFDGEAIPAYRLREYIKTMLWSRTQSPLYVRAQGHEPIRLTKDLLKRRTGVLQELQARGRAIRDQRLAVKQKVDADLFHARKRGLVLRAHYAVLGTAASVAAGEPVCEYTPPESTLCKYERRADGTLWLVHGRPRVKGGRYIRVREQLITSREPVEGLTWAGPAKLAITYRTPKPKAKAPVNGVTRYCRMLDYQAVQKDLLADEIAELLVTLVKAQAWASRV